ncbi:unnamed protein product [Auanema sp. JU1783]|nr:unnamed protein product [Auanema sp. JU1783]
MVVQKLLNPTVFHKSSSRCLNTISSFPTFKYVDQLSGYLAKNFILHEPGKFVIIPKPYGISCVGEMQPSGGVFKSGRFDEKDENFKMSKRKSEKDISITDCLPNLQHYFREPRLEFCVGLKRYLSGAIVLPCNEKESSRLVNSVKFASLQRSEDDTHYRVIAVLMGNLGKNEGSVSGYSTFLPMGSHKEYTFIEGKASKRAKSGKFAVEGSLSYKVLSRKYGCTLVEFGVNKFSRHLPRLIFSHLQCPILGDKLYASRLADIDGKPVNVNRSKQNRNIKLWCPAALSQKLEMNPDLLRQSIPLYCHVYSTVFPRYGWVPGLSKDQQDVTDLVASVPPPDHFLSMVRSLDMETDLMKFFRENEDLASPEVGRDLSF